MATCLACSRPTTRFVCSACGSRAGVRDWKFNQERDFIDRVPRSTYTGSGACLGLAMLWILETRFGHGQGGDFFHRLSVSPPARVRVAGWMSAQDRFAVELASHGGPFPDDEDDSNTARGRAIIRWVWSLEGKALIERWARDYNLRVLDRRIGVAAGRSPRRVWEEFGRHGASGPGLRLLNVVGPSGGGHAMASYGNASLGIFRVFDPNYGQCSFPSAAAQGEFVTNHGLRHYATLSDTWFVDVVA